MTDTAPPEVPAETPSPAAPRQGRRRHPQAPVAGARTAHPVLEQLAALYPQLFGAVFHPLKRGIFHDLQAAHPGVFAKEDLKTALGLHTRSTRYLQAVAAGEQRRDLAGQPVEAMAPEHVHHALLEVYRRRKGRATEDLLPRLRQRIIATFEASGLSREDYTARVASRDEAANALLEEAFAEWMARNARDEALLRAFEASGQTLEAFADMYGIEPRAAAQQLERARRVAAAKGRSAP
ncbi:MAG: ProQ/FINO family protein [Ottowia sp.]|uniref:ProQ/FINO family protein n=1 Tax=Ottowia sp. TaxID=1898956 RepID=UPI0039E67A6C